MSIDEIKALIEVAKGDDDEAGEEACFRLGQYVAPALVAEVERLRANEVLGADHRATRDQCVALRERVERAEAERDTERGLKEAAMKVAEDDAALHLSAEPRIAELEASLATTQSALARRIRLREEQLASCPADQREAVEFALSELRGLAGEVAAPALSEEVERLRALVEDAFREGACAGSAGERSPSDRQLDRLWHDSDARRAVRP
jgi:hypothetical protein